MAIHGLVINLTPLPVHNEWDEASEREYKLMRGKRRAAMEIQKKEEHD